MRHFFFLSLCLVGSLAFSQNWNAYPAAMIGSPYTNGLMVATVTRVNTTMNSGTPMFTTSTSPDCYIAAGSLALNTGFFNSYIAGSSRVQVDIDFTLGGTVTGTCNSAAFTIRDINSGESFTDFLDVVEFSGVDGNNVAIPAANIVITNPVNTAVATSGTTRRIVGHNSVAETTTSGPYFSTPCNITSVTITPPAAVPLRSIRILYRPGIGTSSANAYFSVGIRPAVQYISISNLTMTPTGGGCTTLGPEIAAFGASPVTEGNLVTWSLAFAEPNLSEYWIDKSADGSNFERLSAPIDQGSQDFSSLDRMPFLETYYRVSRMDFDGTSHVLGTTSVVRGAATRPLFTLSPNPVQTSLTIHTRQPGSNRATISDMAGRVCWEKDLVAEVDYPLEMDAFPIGMYVFSVCNGGQAQHARFAVQR